MGHTYSTSSNSMTSKSSRLSSGSFLPRSIMLMPECTPFKSAIMEPIMPPGKPHFSKSEDICLLVGSMK